MTKKELRLDMLKRRNSLSAEDVYRNAYKIFVLLKNTKILNFKNILVYENFKNEVSTTAIIKFLIANKRGVFLPKCDTETKTFEAIQIDNAEYKSIINKYGIREPLSQKISSDEFNDKIDAAIVPGIVFDKVGNRIGFGSGYYDKFLKKYPHIYKIGLCYEFQIVDSIENDTFDIPMDILITEKRIIVCNRE